MGLASWILGVSLVAAGSESAFDREFTGATLRLDYYHTGNASEEYISLDRVRVEGPWPGNRRRLIDDTNLGKYRFEVRSVDGDRLLYSRGFASIYGEWETTAEARSMYRTLPEALRFPEPRQPVRIKLCKRDQEQKFQEIWRTELDPSSRFVHRAAVLDQEVWAVQESGPPADKVDLLILADGYTVGETDQFRAQVQRLVPELFREEPFRSRQQDFNVWAIAPGAAESGISRPRAGVFRQNPLGTSYNSFDSERYVLSMDDRSWRDVAAAAPYDTVIILVNERKYGGGGIFNLYATAAARSAYAGYLFVHEFGHSFAGLGDEYFTSPTSYEEFGAKEVEPWEPNVSALLDPAQLKWRDLVTEGTTLPTPWNQDEFATLSRALQKQRADLRAQGAEESELEALFQQEQVKMTRMLDAVGGSRVVGAFEGAMYEARGLYRPSADCIMFTRNEVGFCAVCQQALAAVIDLHTGSP